MSTDRSAALPSQSHLDQVLAWVRTFPSAVNNHWRPFYLILPLAADQATSPMSKTSTRLRTVPFCVMPRASVLVDSRGYLVNFFRMLRPLFKNPPFFLRFSSSTAGLAVLGALGMSRTIARSTGGDSDSRSLRDVCTAHRRYACYYTVKSNIELDILC